MQTCLINKGAVFICRSAFSFLQLSLLFFLKSFISDDNGSALLAVKVLSGLTQGRILKEHWNILKIRIQTEVA